MNTDVERLTNVCWSDDGMFFHAWMFADDGKTPVAYVKMMNYEGEIELCDVEVRKEFRGKKLGMRIIQAVGDMLGQNVIHTDALYTQSGLRSIAPLFVIQHNGKKTRKSLPPMSFVSDWDNMKATLRL